MNRKTPRFSRSYLVNLPAAMSLALTAINILIFSYFYGFWIGLAWGVPALAGMAAAMIYSMRARLGDASAIRPFRMSQNIIIVLWMSYAIALWFTGNRAAWVTASLTSMSWVMHIIFYRQGNKRDMALILAVCIVPLVGFMLDSTWTNYPLWLAIPASGAAACMLVTIWSSAQNSNKAFMDLKNAVAETNATKKRLEVAMAELSAAKDAAEASSKSKSEFLANMSHEIRTPLNGVLGMAQALQADPLDPGEREKVAIILDSGKSLMALLNDVLDLSKIEAGKLEIAPVPSDLLHTVQRTSHLFQAQADEKGLELRVECDSSVPKWSSYDPVRVRQCVSNLISNALKFTTKGSVVVSMSAVVQSDGSHNVTIAVSDTGIGMSEAAMGRLFNVFTQADASTTRRFGGSGLGLFISRQLASMMGGDIRVASEEGKGSTFTLTFNAAEGSPAAEPGVMREAAPAPVRSLRSARILLTDDNAINRQVIRLFLAPQGCVIEEAANGLEALDKLAARAFDLVLLDVHMPVMDGKEAVQRIRASTQAWRTIPVIALTADAMSGDRERYIALGMTDYVSKPIDQRELIARMIAVLGLEPAKQRSQSAA